MPSPHHLILGGQRSGKSRHAERLGRAWLQAADGRSVTVLATAIASDEEMRLRIDRHRLDRPAGFGTVEAPVQLGQAVREAARPECLVIVDCLTLWLTNVLMPDHVQGDAGASPDWPALRADLLTALREADGPVVLVSNEIGLGVIPMGREVRHFVDEMGWLHQDVAQCCGHVTLMVAGQPFTKVVERWV